MGCSNCYRSTTIAYMEKFKCHKCPTKDTHAFPRARIDVILTDPSADATVTFFGKDAETILGCTAVTMCEADLQLPNAAMSEINLINQQTEHTVYIRGSDYHMNGEKRRRFTASFPRQIVPANDNVQNPMPEIVQDNTGLQEIGIPSPATASSGIPASSSNLTQGSLEMASSSMEPHEEVILWKGKSKINNENNTEDQPSTDGNLDME